MTAIGKRYIMSVDLTAGLPTAEPEGTQCWDAEAQTMMIFIGGSWEVLANNTPEVTGGIYIYADATARTADVGNRAAGDMGYSIDDENTLIRLAAAWSTAIVVT